ncbi:hypothetical protein BDP67DRAFT_493990 [Colletotrichum lupini]|nr:hypothetical protein BDP67DRAFT_493990 [Colletotrichum lupini]
MTHNLSRRKDFYRKICARDGDHETELTVVRFLVQAYKIPQISSTIQSFSEDQIEQFIEASCHLASNDDPSIGAGAVITISYNTTTKSASGSWLLTISRAQYFHGTMRPDAKRLYDIYLAWKESVSKLSDVEGLYPTFVMNIMPKSAQSVAKHNGIRNIWGLDDKEFFVVSGWAAKFGDYHRSVNHQSGLASDFIYMGDASETQNPRLGIPFKNVEKLRQIRAKYGPEGVFTILNWDGYKLGH